MFELSVEVISMLLMAGFVAGFIDAIAGGGGLITLPALMLAGISPAQALATNKIQSAFGSATAAVSYAASGLVDLRTQWKPALMAGLASAVGSIVVSHIPTEGLRLVLPVILIGIAVFFAVKPGLDDLDRTQKITPVVFAVTAAPLIGFYDVLIGPGAGSFYMIAFITLAGYGVLKATAHTKLLNFASNIGGLAAFAAFGHPLWLLGLAMGVAQIGGAVLGSRLASRNGAKLIKPLLVITSTLLALRLIWQLI